MTAPVEHLFRGGERVGPEDVPPEVLAELRRLAVAAPKRGASVMYDCRIYSVVLRDGPHEGEASATAK